MHILISKVSREAPRCYVSSMFPDEANVAGPWTTLSSKSRGQINGRQSLSQGRQTTHGTSVSFARAMMMTLVKKWGQKATVTEVV